MAVHGVPTRSPLLPAPSGTRRGRVMASVARVRALALPALCAAAWVGACRTPADPADWAGAVPLAPPPPYRMWWAVTEACSGLRGDFAAVRWAAVPDAASLPGASDGRVASWAARGNQVTLAGASVLDGATVRHEMLHALLRAPGHPPAYFRGRCGGVVACEDGRCEREGAPEPVPPADAPAIPASALRVSVEVAPATGFPHETAGTGGWAVVVVRATNALPRAAWVDLAHTPGTAEASAYGFGYVRREGPEGLGTGGDGVTEVVPGRRLGFGAGETKQRAFDLDLRGRGAGPFAVRGFFNADTTAAVVLRFPP